MKALLAQIEPAPGDVYRNTDRAVELIVGANADLIVFPELCLPGYDLRSVRAAAIDADSPPIATIRAAASDAHTAVIVGFAESRGSSVSNAAALIDERGVLVAVYRKIQLFGDEQAVFEPGEKLFVAELAGRLVGTLICFDMEFPEPARALARAGVDLLVTVAANMEPFYSDHRIASQARALDNRIPHLYCNRCGTEAGIEFVGGSRALRADGTIADEAGSEEALLAVSAASRGVDDDRVDYLSHLPQAIDVQAPTSVTGGNT